VDQNGDAGQNTQTSQNDQADNGGASATTDRTFSQADVDRIVQDRLARQKAQYQGFDDYKTKAEQFDEMQAAQMSELEKANKRAADLERALADATAQRQESILRASVVAEGAKRNVVDPYAALALLDRSTLEFDDQGNPTNIATAMDSLLAQRTYLVAPAGGTRGNADLGARGTAGADQLTREALASMTPEQIAKAEADGRLAHLLGAKT
jgi:hypothetical protein